MPSLMKVCAVVGSGGRESFYTLLLAQSPLIERIYVAPGNGDTARMVGKVMNVCFDAKHQDAFVDFCRDNGVTCVVCGPEDPLVAGLADRLAEVGIVCFGPKQAAAMLEGSKSFAHALLDAAGVATAEYAVFNDAAAARAFVREHPEYCVVKADGLCAGKGVTVGDSVAETIAAIDACMVEKRFGKAGEQAVLEKRLIGEELSVMVFVDEAGHSYTMRVSQDHKRRFEGNKGPNTGGMGAYSPVPIATPELMAQIQSEIVDRTLAELQRKGIAYCGILYFGLMITEDGPKVLELNCRGGDPESQVVLALMVNDFAEVIEACVSGTLNQVTFEWRNEHSVLTVLVMDGYPDAYPKGKRITCLNAASEIPGVTLIGAGVTMDRGVLRTNGGRVYDVLALGSSFAEAHRRSIAAARAVKFNGKAFRRDIGVPPH